MFLPKPVGDSIISNGMKPRVGEYNFYFASRRRVLIENIRQVFAESAARHLSSSLPKPTYLLKAIEQKAVYDDLGASIASLKHASIQVPHSVHLSGSMTY
jgi:hypothetical protein